MDGSMHAHRVHAAKKTAVSPDEPLANGRDIRLLDSGQKFSADRRAGEVDLIDRALGVFAFSSLLRVRALEP